MQSTPQLWQLTLWMGVLVRSSVETPLVAGVSPLAFFSVLLSLTPLAFAS